MTTKNKAEGWVIALIVIGVIFIAWGVYSWQKGSSLQELTPAEKKLTITIVGSAGSEQERAAALAEAAQFWEVYERWHDGEDYVNMGQTMLVVGSILTIGGGISLIRRGK